VDRAAAICVTLPYGSWAAVVWLVSLCFASNTGYARRRDNRSAAQ